MGVNLLHVRFKVAVDNAEQQFHALFDETGDDAFLLSASGDTAHFLIPNFFGIHAIDHVVPDYDAYDASFIISGFDQEGDEDEGDVDTTPLELAHWWGQVRRAPYRRGPGFHRRALLILTDGERRENSRILEKIQRMLGPDSSRQWHGRDSILFTFWDSGYGATVQSGQLGRALEHGEIYAAYLFDLTRDFAAMHDNMSTMATWFAREATYAPPRPRQELEKAPRDPNFGMAVKGPLRSFEVSKAKLPPRRKRDV